MDGDALKQQVASLEGSTRVGMDALLENITRLRRQLAGFALDDVIVEAKRLGWNIDVQREHFIFTAPDGEEIAISFDRLDWQDVAQQLRIWDPDDWRESWLPPTPVRTLTGIKLAMEAGSRLDDVEAELGRLKEIPKKTGVIARAVYKLQFNTMVLDVQKQGWRLDREDDTRYFFAHERYRLMVGIAKDTPVEEIQDQLRLKAPDQARTKQPPG